MGIRLAQSTATSRTLHVLRLTTINSPQLFENLFDFLPPVPQGFSKIILSTTLAESSLTIKEVDVVIDFCLVRIPFFDPYMQVKSIITAWASQASCTQRKGRTGRVGPGQVIRIVPKNTFSYLRQFALPQILSGAFCVGGGDIR